MKDNRILGIGLALAAAACLIYASVTRHWLVNSSRFEEIGFGLRDNYQCASLTEGHPECQEQTNSAFIEKWQDVGDTASQFASGVFAPMGWATLVECLLAALGLVAAAALALANKQPQLPITPSTLGLLGVMATLITGMIFVAKKPGPPGFVGVGISFWVFGAGAVLGIAGAQMLAKVNRPKDPDLLEDAMNPDQF